MTANPERAERTASALFVFTDDLDVTNRLYFDLLDAEGLNSWGTPEKPSLALHREPHRRTISPRDAPPARRGSPRADRAPARRKPSSRIGRTTSQDADVDRSRDRDRRDRVAWRSDSTTRSRRGHCSTRRRTTRSLPAAQRPRRHDREGCDRGPSWSCPTTAEIARTYESYERLFDPELARRARFPIANPAVVRMQAVFATLDWLGSRTTGQAHRCGACCERPQAPAQSGERDRQRQRWRTAARDRSRGPRAPVEPRRPPSPGALGQARSHRQRDLLGATAAAADDGRFQRPSAACDRVAHLELGPQVGTWWGWAAARVRRESPLRRSRTAGDHGRHARPDAHEDEHHEPMRAVQALNAYAPGRVSHRLTIAHRYARHWVAPPSLNADGHAAMDIHAFSSEFEELGVFATQAQHPVRVVRPLHHPGVSPAKRGSKQFARTPEMERGNGPFGRHAARVRAARGEPPCRPDRPSGFLHAWRPLPCRGSALGNGGRDRVACSVGIEARDGGLYRPGSRRPTDRDWPGHGRRRRGGRREPPESARH